MKQFFIMLVASTLLFTACKDDGDPSDNSQNKDKRYVLVEMTEDYDIGTFIQHYFSYDKQGRLISKRTLQTFTDGQANTDDTTTYTYENNVITEQRFAHKKPYILQLNDDRLLTVLNRYNYSIDTYLPQTYKYDDAQRLKTISEPDSVLKTAIWNGDDLVKITSVLYGNEVYTATIVPSTLTTSGFYPIELGDMSQEYLIMGIYGKMPKHLPATVANDSKGTMGTISTKHSFSYTITDGLVREYTDQVESEIDIPALTQKSNYTVRYVLVWKEID